MNSSVRSFIRRLGSVRIRVTVGATLVFGLAFALASVLLVNTIETRLEERAEDEGRRALRTAVEQIAAGEDASRAIAATRAPVYAWVIAPDGEILYGAAFAPPVDRLESSRMTSGRQRASPAGEVVYFAQRVSGPRGPLTIAVASPLEGAQDSAATLGRGLWLLTALLTIGVGALAWFIAGWALRPVDAIRSEVLAISDTTMHRRVPVPAGRDEVRRLAETMNEMLDRLERSTARQREFVSDASHELRSPVAAMRTDLEVALRDPRGADWPALANRLLAENERLAALVEDLLELARLEEGRADAPHEAVDVDELVLADIGRRTGRIHFDTSAVSGGRTRGSARQLAQVVRNLLDNAARHAQGRVAVSVRTDGHDVLLTVEDDGPGIAEDDRERVFDRFTRLDGARTRDGGGSGLGLAVVRRIVDAHGGTVGVANGGNPSQHRVSDGDGPGGARFEVRLPTSV